MAQASIKCQIGVRPMVQRTQVLYVDDIDGSDAEGTVRFGIGGTEDEIGLNKKHAGQLAKAIGPHIYAARKVPPSPRAGGGPPAPPHDPPVLPARARRPGLPRSPPGPP